MSLKSLMNFLDTRSRRLGMVEWKLAQGAALCIGIIAVKIFPEILRIDIWWLIGLTVVLYLRPLYLFYFGPQLSPTGAIERTAERKVS